MMTLSGQMMLMQVLLLLVLLRIVMLVLMGMLVLQLVMLMLLEAVVLMMLVQLVLLMVRMGRWRWGFTGGSVGQRPDLRLRRRYRNPTGSGTLGLHNVVFEMIVVGLMVMVVMQLLGLLLLLHTVVKGQLGPSVILLEVEIVVVVEILVVLEMLGFHVPHWFWNYRGNYTCLYRRIIPMNPDASRKLNLE